MNVKSPIKMTFEEYMLIRLKRERPRLSIRVFRSSLLSCRQLKIQQVASIYCKNAGLVVLRQKIMFGSSSPPARDRMNFGCLVAPLLKEPIPLYNLLVTIFTRQKRSITRKLTVRCKTKDRAMSSIFEKIKMGTSLRVSLGIRGSQELLVKN